MSVTLVFNDASIPFKSIETCRQYIPVFFSILRKAIKNEVHIIRTKESVGNNWFKIHYAEGFSLSQWIDQQSDREYKRYIKSIMDKTISPLVGSAEKEINAVLKQSEFYLSEDSDQQVIALGVAFLCETPVVSFCSMQRWKKNRIEVVHSHLDEQATEIVKKECSVDNISQDEHISFFLEKIKEERQASHDYLKQLRTSGSHDYKNLIFCANVLNNFERHGVHKSLLVKITDVLKKLNIAIQNTDNENHFVEYTGLNISGESQTTINKKKLLKHRIFKLPNAALSRWQHLFFSAR